MKGKLLFLVLVGGVFCVLIGRGLSQESPPGYTNSTQPAREVVRGKVVAINLTGDTILVDKEITHEEQVINVTDQQLVERDIKEGDHVYVVLDGQGTAQEIEHLKRRVNKGKGKKSKPLIL